MKIWKSVIVSTKAWIMKKIVLRMAKILSQRNDTGERIRTNREPSSRLQWAGWVGRAHRKTSCSCWEPVSIQVLNERLVPFPQPSYLKHYISPPLPSCHFSPEDRDSMFLRNVGIYGRNSTAPKLKTLTSARDLFHLKPAWNISVIMSGIV
jgi:hypothetical protein